MTSAVKTPGALAPAKPLAAAEQPEILVHPYANAWPLMVGVARDAFVADMKAKGQRVAAVIQKSSGLLIDGRNRKNACDILKIPLLTVVEDVPDDGLLDWLKSINRMRRHTTTTQDACTAAELATMCRGRNKSANLPIKPLSQDDAAKLMGVSTRSVGKAVAIRKSHPKLFEHMKTGELTLGKAERAIKPPVQKEEPEVEEEEDDEIEEVEEEAAHQEEAAAPQQEPPTQAHETSQEPETAATMPADLLLRQAVRGLQSWNASFGDLACIAHFRGTLDRVIKTLEDAAEAAA
jgi:predicted DNA-binding protein (UPF0251 family)